MRIRGNPIEPERQRATADVNQHFNALVEPHRDAVHRIKRDFARAVLAGEPRLDLRVFEAEAALHDLTVAELAEIVLAQPDTLMQREVERQRIMRAIDYASTTADLDAILLDAGIIRLSLGQLP